MTIEKINYMSYFLNFFFHMNEFWNSFFLQLVIINAYNCPST
jgi:hypothetical protein